MMHKTVGMLASPLRAHEREASADPSRHYRSDSKSSAPDSSFPVKYGHTRCDVFTQKKVKQIISFRERRRSCRTSRRSETPGGTSRSCTSRRTGSFV